MRSEGDFPHIVIAGGNCRITLCRTGAPLDYGIPTKIEVVAGPFSGVFQDRFVGSFERFVEQIEAMHETLQGKAELGSLEDHLKLALKAEALGHISVICKIVAEHFPRIDLNFEFSIDQSYLPRIARDVRRFLDN